MFTKITEQDAPHDNLEHKTTLELLELINQQDQQVAHAVHLVIDQINNLVQIIVKNMKSGGRLFYIGAGTSGRLGILDASECPPTFGISPDKVLGIIAGGDKAIRNAVEHAEDNTQQAYNDLQQHNINQNDVVIGIAASGTTPYVLGGIKDCNRSGITTGAITCNPDSPIATTAQYPITPVVGPEFITGSSRMKSGTAQKMILNMISTTVMIQLGHIKGNKMIDMQLSNNKLVDRGTRMIMQQSGLSYDHAQQALLKHGSVRAVLDQLSTR